MSGNRPRDRVSLSVDPHAEAGTPREASGQTLHIVVVADLSGADEGRAGSVERADRLKPVALEWVDDLLSRVRPSVDLEVGDSGPFRVEFRELEDFHPDRLVDQIPVPRTMPGSTSDAGSGTSRSEPKSPAAAPGAPSKPVGREVPAAGLLDDIVEAAPERTEGVPEGPLGDLHGWVGEVVGQHLEVPEGGDRAASRGRLEEAMAARVRDVLIHPAVRALERSWRSLFFLSAAVDAAPEVRLHVLDLSRRELESLLADEDFGEGELQRALSEPLPGPGRTGPLGLLVACYDFGADADDLSLLNRLAALAYLTGSPILASAAATLLGWSSFRAAYKPRPVSSPAWEVFRATEAAGSVALFAPGFLLREPYGPDSDPCELPAFEELGSVGEAGYLWGSPAILGAAAAVDGFRKAGWSFDLEQPFDRASMPIHVTAGDEVGAHPVEALWSVDVVGEILELGINPLVGYRGEARVRLPGIRSASAATTSLRAWWSN